MNSKMKRRSASIAAVVSALSAVTLALVLTSGSPASAGGEPTSPEFAQRDAAGFDIRIDGERLPDIVVGSAVANVRYLAKAAETNISDAEVAQTAAAGAVLQGVLESIGREHTGEITDDDIREMLRDATSIGDVYDGDISPAMTPEELAKAKDELVRNPEKRASVESSLYRTRGLNYVLDGRSLGEPGVLDELIGRYERELVDRGVTAVTPHGKLSIEQLVELGLRAPAAQQSD